MNKAWKFIGTYNYTKTIRIELLFVKSRQPCGRRLHARIVTDLMNYDMNST